MNLRYPNDKLTRALLAVVENGIEIKSVIANIRVIGMDKFRWSTDVRFESMKKMPSIRNSRLLSAFRHKYFESFSRNTSQKIDDPNRKIRTFASH